MISELKVKLFLFCTSEKIKDYPKTQSASKSHLYKDGFILWTLTTLLSLT